MNEIYIGDPLLPGDVGCYKERAPIVNPSSSPHPVAEDTLLTHVVRFIDGKPTILTVKPRPEAVEPLVWTGTVERIGSASNCDDYGIIPLRKSWIGKTVEVREVPSETPPPADVDLGPLSEDEFDRLRPGDRICPVGTDGVIYTVMPTVAFAGHIIAIRGDYGVIIKEHAPNVRPAKETAIRLGRGKRAPARRVAVFIEAAKQGNAPDVEELLESLASLALSGVDDFGGSYVNLQVDKADIEKAREILVKAKYEAKP